MPEVCSKAYSGHERMHCVLRSKAQLLQSPLWTRVLQRLCDEDTAAKMSALPEEVQKHRGMEVAGGSGCDWGLDEEMSRGVVVVVVIAVQ